MKGKVPITIGLEYVLSENEFSLVPITIGDP